ncbi:hypothetical protein EVJ58_g7979 [Rhodofomes roseus]|uniref:Uncharacterized protein n=1 Tax=Rhodofomes roseus TaxID=34475 RepID=A0A4Y9Y290_9APHY|nr:hypothetical protein EVJ58_g7979 [Rhodofomes roseus]
MAQEASLTVTVAPAATTQSGHCLPNCPTLQQDSAAAQRAEKQRKIDTDIKVSETVP